MRTIITVLALALLLPATAPALDCLPFQSFDCANGNYYDVLDGQPGEVVCGVDYTGWTLHTIEVTVTTPGWYTFIAISAAASWNVVPSAVMLMDDCGAGTCLDSVTAPDQAQLEMCLDTGTHTLVVASDTTAPTAFMNIGLFCHTCEDAVAYGFECVHCGTVSAEDLRWGEIKSRFR